MIMKLRLEQIINWHKLGDIKMRFAVLKNQLRAKFVEVDEAAKSYLQELEFVNDGPKYSNQDLFSKYNYWQSKLMELDELHEIACKFDTEFCLCGSGLIPNGVNEKDEPSCKECDTTRTIESNGAV